MRVTSRLFPLLVLTVLAASACSRAHPERPQPQRSYLSIVADSIIQQQLHDTHWGIEILDQERNEIIFAHNAHRHFVPASNTKLVVTTVALGLLGPDFRYRTPIYLAGAAADSAPRGLLLIGQGDPTWSGRYHGDDFAVVNMLADSLRARGVRRIAGDIIIDASYFTDESVHSAWEVGDLPWYYAAPTSALAIGEAAVRMIVDAGNRVGAPASVSVVGAAVPLPVVMRALTDTAGAGSSIDVDFTAWPDTLLITGKLGLGKADSSWIAVPDPAAFAGEALRTALARAGIVTTGRVRVARDTATARMLRAPFQSSQPALTWTSVPLIEIVAGILKPSQNWIAEQVLKTLGARFQGAGSWRGGIATERRYLIDVARIDSTAFSLRDASGLSAQNLLSPRATLLLLEHARNAPWGAQYQAAMPVPGGRGTLSSRLAGLEDRVAAKTGSIANVNSLSGYARTFNGSNLTFVILTNGSGRPSAEVRGAIDRIVNAFVREGPTP